MKRILFSLSLIAVVGAISAGATGAFFSDTETSTGNTFTAGAIDLKIDNTSYYNGVATSTTSWSLADLTVQKFFNFFDLKPGDYGEDTISLHIDTNDAYLCANVALTSNDDNGLNEPEALVDQTDGAGNGELATNVNFIMWPDDGDNVLEGNEGVLYNGPIGAIGVGNNVTIPFADSATNIWTGVGGPAPGGVTKYVGKAWCFGAIAAQPLVQDNASTTNPSQNRDASNPAGQPSDGGYLCNGSLLNNSTQTDSLTADITFTATQARNNPGFLCSPQGCTFDANANLVTNGGFEAPEVIDGAQWDIFPSPAAGWNILWRDDPAPPGRPAIANIELHEGVLGVAFEGNQYTELDSDWNGHAAGPDGEPSATTIYQNIPTQVGAHYSLTYRFAPRPGTSPTDNNLESRLGGQVMDTTGGVAGGGGNLVLGDWVLKGPFDFVATTTITQLRFTDLGTTNNSLGTFLDDVQVKQTSCVNVQ